jgi:hypothetical protein
VIEALGFIRLCGSGLTGLLLLLPLCGSGLTRLLLLLRLCGSGLTRLLLLLRLCGSGLTRLLLLLRRCGSGLRRLFRVLRQINQPSADDDPEDHEQRDRDRQAGVCARIGRNQWADRRRRPSGRRGLRRWRFYRRRGLRCPNGWVPCCTLFTKPQDLLHRPGQAADMNVEILAAIDLDRVAVGKIVKTLGQCLGKRHHRVRHQHRDYRLVLAQRGFYLKPHQVGRVCQSTVFIVGAYPSRPDDRQDNVALVKHPVDVASKIGTRRYIVDVTEHRFTAEMPGQPVENAAGDVERVVAAVGDRDPRHRTKGADQSSTLASIACWRNRKPLTAWVCKKRPKPDFWRRRLGVRMRMI